MSHSMRRLTAAEQTAVHLREGIRAGRWWGRLPGVLALAAECDVSPATMRGAIRLLEEEGWIHAAGAGRPRTAGPPEDGQAGVRRSLRVMVLPGMRMRDEDAAFQQVVSLLQHDLEAAGHVCRIAQKSQEDLRHDVGRIERFVSRQASDAWVVIGGRHEVVAWFARQPQPAICIGGGISGQPIAATGMLALEGFEQAMRHLVSLGHRRILFLWPPHRLDLASNPCAQTLGSVLSEAGSQMTSYHVPMWKATPEGLREILERTFQFTPPTAIITTYGKWMAGVLSFLAARSMRSPRDISLFSLNEDEWFAWKEPVISCLRGDDTQMVRRIVRWVDAVARGQGDRRFIGFPQQWIQGGTIGPAQKT